MSDIYADVATLQEQMSEVQLDVSDTGWIDLPLDGDVQSYNDGLRPKYRKIGNEVFLSGVLKNVTAANTTLARLPEGFRPVRQSYFIAGSPTTSAGEATFFNCQVNADGYIRITTHSKGIYNANNYLRLNSSFLIAD